jgi:hypothetical protein
MAKRSQNDKTMVRKQFFFTVEQSRRLKMLAAATGEAEAEIVRRAIDNALSGGTSRRDWRDELDRVVSQSGEFDALAGRVLDMKKHQGALFAQRLGIKRKRRSAA